MKQPVCPSLSQPLGWVVGGGWGAVWTLARHVFCLPRAQNLPRGGAWDEGSKCHALRPQKSQGWAICQGIRRGWAVRVRSQGRFSQGLHRQHRHQVGKWGGLLSFQSPVCFSSCGDKPQGYPVPPILPALICSLPHSWVT